MPLRDTRFKWLLYLLPASFREDHATDILGTWRDERQDAAREGRRGVWRRALKDTVQVAPREHAAIWVRNVTLAARRLRRSPAFALTAIFTLALGTGATAAVFSLVNAVLLRPLPWRTPERVGVIWAVQPSGERTWLSFPELEELRREPGSFSAVAGLTDLRPHFLAGGVGQELQALAVSYDLFELLGVAPAIGRSLSRDDDRHGSGPVALLSDAFWSAQFGRDPSVIGRPIVLNDRPHTVVGILPAGFAILPPSSVIPEHVDVWLPLEAHLISRDRTVRFLHVLARLADDATFAGATGELQNHASRVRERFAAAYPGGDWGFTVAPFAADVLRSVRPALYLLSGLVGLVLLMACANVANLFLARGETRRTELAIRTALGAGPVRLAGELIAEALVLAVCGSAGGLALAAAAPALLLSLDPGALPRLDEVRVDVTVAVFMAGLVLLTAATFVAVPLVERLRVRTAAVLTAGRGGSRTPRSVRVGKTLVIVQAALATSIVITTLFLTDTLVDLQRVDLGFATERFVTARISLSAKYSTGPAIAQFFDEAIAAAERTPVVERAAAITQLPLSGAMLGSTFLVGDTGQPRRIDADLRGITPGYFTVAGTPLIAGRSFSEADSAASPPVAIVDEVFARRLNASGEVVGRRIQWMRLPDVEVEIVGVVRASHHRGPAVPPRETVYRPHRQYARASMFLAVKTRQDPAQAVPAIRAAVASVDRTQAFADVSTMAGRMERALSRARTSMMLAATLAAMALSLGLVGLYGVLSFGVAQRLREFGVRMALGASPAAVRRMVLREGLLLTAAGAGLGVIGAVLVARTVRSVLLAADAGVQQYIMGVCLVLACSAAAFWLPARRAGAADPGTILRSD